MGTFWAHSEGAERKRHRRCTYDAVLGGGAQESNLKDARRETPTTAGAWHTTQRDPSGSRFRTVPSHSVQFPLGAPRGATTGVTRAEASVGIVHVQALRSPSYSRVPRRGARCQTRPLALALAEPVSQSDTSVVESSHRTNLHR